MFYNILSQNRLKILPLFRNLKDEFYLAGGTALALQMGHRDSADFDFFCANDIDTKKLFDNLTAILKDYKVLKIQEAKNTLSVLIDDNVKLSFFTYKYKLLNKTIDEENLRLASVEDIGCMKLSAITGRASNKDYIDLYYILQNIKLEDLLEGARKKFADLDVNLILKSLIYFEDVTMEPIAFKNDNYVDFEKVKKVLREEVGNVVKV